MKLISQETTLTPESIDDFRNWLSVRGRSVQTIKAYTTDIRSFMKETGEVEISLDQFPNLAMYWLQRNRRIVAPKTTGRRLTSLRAFAKFVGQPNCMDEYTPPTPARSQPHPLPEGIEGVRKMIDAARYETHKALVALCGLCGCRVAEAIAARPSHFNLTEMTLTIRGKGDRTRVVPVSEEALDVLMMPLTRAFVAGDRPIVGLKDRAARSIITTLGERAGLRRHVSSHDLRATFATAVYDKCRDQRVVQELLGHANGSTTEIYIGRTMHQMKEAVAL